MAALRVIASLATVAAFGCSGWAPIPAEELCEGPFCTWSCASARDCPCGAECQHGLCNLSQEVPAQCEPCMGDSECSLEKRCHEHHCTPICPPAERCEAGGDCCLGNDECVEGTCRPPCMGTRCGADSELCCATDELCVADRCVPMCEGRSRCGPNLEICCGVGETCYGSSCTAASQPCQHQSDCDAGEVCEPDLAICLPDEVVGSCTYQPPVGEFEPEIECRWTPPADQVTPERVDVVMAPVVGNLTDDNGDGKTDTFDVPDIVFTSYQLYGEGDAPEVGCCNVFGTLRIASGRCQEDGTMLTHASLSEPPIDNSGGIAIGDLDGDNVGEIVAMTIREDGKPEGTVAFKRMQDDGSEWAVLWRNPDYPRWDVHTRGAAQPSLADIDGDGSAEVVIGNLVLNGLNGSLVWDGAALSPSSGVGNNAFLGPVSTVADIDLDGSTEVIAGNSCFGANGELEWTYTYTTSASACGGALTCDGYNAVGNFDGDPEGEVVIVRLGEVFVLNHDGSLLAQVAVPWDDCERDGRILNESGPPTVADFDGDGRPEIGTAGADYYAVIDLDCLSPRVQTSCADEGVLWFAPNQDCSSRATASSVFDFDGDGRAEAIYADERNFRIFDGPTGDVLFDDDTHGSHTRLEMIVIADVDNDGNAEVVLAENGYYDGTPGIEVWGDVLDNWVYTRRVWNQHSYHVSNVTESLSVPAHEAPSWSEPALNNFRQNLQGEGLFLAPDLAILNLDGACFGAGSVELGFDVMNLGSRMVGAGVAVAVYTGGELAETLHTADPLLPGRFQHFVLRLPLDATLLNEPVSIEVRADDTGDGVGENNECDEGNNDRVFEITCYQSF